MPSRTPRLAALAAGLLLAAAGRPRAAELQDVALSRIAAQGAPAPVAARPHWADATEQGVSLLPQLPDASSRNQQDVGSCHAFGSVALLEAAYYRQHGEKVRLSEADVFLRRTVLSPELYDQFCSNGKCELSEGNDPEGDIRFALQNGVATSLQYDAFVKRYVAYRKAEQETMKGIQKAWEEESWIVKLLYDPRKHWARLQQEPRAKRLISDYLSGRDPQAAAQRAEMKKKFEGFALLSQSFDYAGAKAKNWSAEESKKRGRKQKEAILAELKKHRPVTVSMSLVGLPAWGEKDAKDDDNHAFMLVGYRNDPKKGLVFETRNSWGGDNPDVTEADLCRVYSVVTIRTPADK